MDVGGHRVVEHQGLLPGFDSQMFVAPDDGVGVIAFTNGTRRGAMWLPAETGGLLRRLLGAPDDADPHRRAAASRDLGATCAGGTPWPGRSPTCGSGAHGEPGRRSWCAPAGSISGSSRPIPPLYRGFDLHPDDPDDPYVFRLDFSEFGMAGMRLVFGRAPRREDDGSPPGPDAGLGRQAARGHQPDALARRGDRAGHGRRRWPCARAVARRRRGLVGAARRA